MARSIHPDDAFAFIVQTLKQGRAAQPGAGHGHEVWVPDIVWQYLVGEGYDRNKQSDFYYEAELDGVWGSFYDAVWRLCRMGILRPGPSAPRYASSGPVFSPRLLVHISGPSLG